MVILCEKKKTFPINGNGLSWKAAFKIPFENTDCFESLAILCMQWFCIGPLKIYQILINFLKIVKDSKKFRLRSLTNKLFGVPDKNHTEISHRVASDDKVAGTSLAVYQNRTKYEPG